MPKVSQSYLDARRNEILDAAWACFGRSGYHQTTMQDICQESELSPGAIYRYFKGKEDILAAISERSLAMGRRLVEEARSDAAGPLDSLRMVGVTMLGAFSHPMFEMMTRVNIELWPEILRNDVLREGMRAELAFWHEAVTQILTEAAAQGLLKEGVDPEVAATLQICAYEGLRHYNLILPEKFKPEALLSLGQTFASQATPTDAAVLLGSPDNAGTPLGTRVTRRPARPKKAAPRGPKASRRDSRST